MTSKNRHSKVSKPIPIGMHHTVCGHEAKDLAKRLTDELASQQGGSLGFQRNTDEPRARSYENRDAKAKSKFVSYQKVIQLKMYRLFPGDHKYYQSLQAVNDQGIHKFFVIVINISVIYACCLQCSVELIVNLILFS